jgi:hypothetical protein
MMSFQRPDRVSLFCRILFQVIDTIVDAMRALPATTENKQLAQHLQQIPPMLIAEADTDNVVIFFNALMQVIEQNQTNLTLNFIVNFLKDGLEGVNAFGTGMSNFAHNNLKLEKMRRDFLDRAQRFKLPLPADEVNYGRCTRFMARIEQKAKSDTPRQHRVSHHSRRSETPAADTVSVNASDQREVDASSEAACSTKSKTTVGTGASSESGWLDESGRSVDCATVHGWEGGAHPYVDTYSLKGWSDSGSTSGKYPRNIGASRGRHLFPHRANPLTVKTPLLADQWGSTRREEVQPVWSFAHGNQLCGELLNVYKAVAVQLAEHINSVPPSCAICFIERRGNITIDILIRSIFAFIDKCN